MREPTTLTELPPEMKSDLALSILTYDLLEIAVETYKPQADSTFLVNCLKTVFSSPEALGKSFLVSSIFNVYRCLILNNWT
jgi:hypothetical protein